MKRLVKICIDNNILIIMDEVYTGVGKTGNFLTVDHWNITPDILCLGKALGGGFPLATVVTKQEITDDTLGSAKFTGTFSGNLVACATGLATLNHMERERLDENAAKVGKYLKQSLQALSEEKNQIGDVRGLGLLIGLDLVKNKNTHKPDGAYATIIIRKALESGLITRKVGRYGNVIALTPPLVLTKTQVKHVVGIFRNILD